MSEGTLSLYYAANRVIVHVCVHMFLLILTYILFYVSQKNISLTEINTEILTKLLL